MKTKKYIFYILMFLPLAAVLIALQFLPDQIPAHYDFNNQVTRWGSKYETLFFPAITVAFGFFMLGMAKYSAKHEENESNNENVCIITGIASLVVFNAMTGYFLYTDFNAVEDLSSIAFDIYQLIFGLFGIFMIIIGIKMSKLRKNSSVNLGGILFIVGGIAIIVVCLLTKGLPCFLWTMGISAILSILYLCWAAVTM